MNKLLITILSLSTLCSCHAKNESNFATSFFNSHSKIVDDEGLGMEFICNDNELDSLLMSAEYHIARMYDTIPYFSNKPSIVFFLTNEKTIDELNEQPNSPVANNLFVVFEQSKSGAYYLSDYFYLLLNQGCIALRFTDLVMQNDKLFIRQYGGNRFGTWGTELEFDNSELVWMYSNAKLFTTVDELDDDMDFLIWSKEAKDKLPINKVNFSDIFSSEELEWVVDGVYK